MSPSRRLHDSYGSCGDIYRPNYDGQRKNHNFKTHSSNINRTHSRRRHHQSNSHGRRNEYPHSRHGNYRSSFRRGRTSFSSSQAGARQSHAWINNHTDSPSGICPNDISQDSLRQRPSATSVSSSHDELIHKHQRDDTITSRPDSETFLQCHLTNDHSQHLQLESEWGAQYSEQARVEPIVIGSLYESFDQNVAAYGRRDIVKCDHSIDHISAVPMFRNDFQHIQERATDIIQMLKSALPRGQQHQPAWARLTETVGGLQTQHEGDPVRVAIVGAIGQGKSYLTGALLGDFSVIKEGDSGKSLTRVVIEYFYWDGGYQYKYQAWVHLFSWEVVKERLTQSFQHYLNRPDDETADENLQDINEKIDSATETFQALFPEGSSWYYETHLAEVLSDKEATGTREAVRAEMLKQAEVLYRRCEVEATGTLINAQTADKLWATLLPYTNGHNFDSSGRKFDPWPFVEHVRIGGKFQVTKHNVRVADTPGMDDINHLNRDRTQQYLARCAVTVVVKNISRVLSDTNTRQYIIEALRRPRSGHQVFLVCTRTGEIGTQERVHFNKDESGDLKYWRMKQQNLAKSLESLGPSSTMELRQEIKFEQRLVALRLTELHIKERNRRVRLEISKWVDVAPHGIYCVSASDYKANIEGYPLIDIEKLPIPTELTEIPALKQRIAAIAAGQVERNLWTLIADSLPSYVDSISMACFEYSSSFSFTIPRGVDYQSEKCAESFNSCIDFLFEKYLSDEHLGAIPKRLEELVRHAEEFCDVRSSKTWSPAQFRVFIKNFGKHYTKKIPRTSWNATLLEPIRKLLDPAFSLLMASIRGELIKTEMHINTIISRIIDHLESTCPRPMPHSLRIICRQSNLRRRLVKQFMNDCAIKLCDFLRLQQGLCCEDNGNSYFNHAMLDVYEQCQRSKLEGRKDIGIHQLRTMTFKNGVCRNDDSSPYLQIHAGLRRALDEEREVLKHNLRVWIQNLLQGLADDLERAQAQQPQQRNPESEMRDEYQRQAVAMAKETLNRMQQMLLDIPGWTVTE